MIKKFCEDFCGEHGWLWEPQAPQMPHANNLDLAVFPSMSHAHSALLQQNNNHQANPERIWQKVWNDMRPAIIARGFVHAYRICGAVIRHGGDNDFLQCGKFHQNTRQDFVGTHRGITKVAN